MKHVRTETRYYIKNTDNNLIGWPYGSRFPEVLELDDLGIGFYLNEPITLVSCQVDIYKDRSRLTAGQVLPPIVERPRYNDYMDVESKILRKQHGELILV